jgi:hypothetical protein
MSFLEDHEQRNKWLNTSNETRAVILHGWKIIADLCHRLYWTQTWIVQELLLSQRLILCCGSEKTWWPFSVAVALPSLALRRLGDVIIQAELSNLVSWL